MPLRRMRIAIFFLSLSLACAVPRLLAGKKNAADKETPDISDQRRALHALNRLTFGPRAGDIQQVMAMGVDRWIDLQLHPEKIDDSALNSRLEPFRTLRMSTKEIVEDFPDPQEIEQALNGKRSIPSDPARRAIYEVQVARLQDRKDKEKDRKEEVARNVDAAPAVDKTKSAAAERSEMAANGTADVADNTAMTGPARDDSAMSPST